MPRKHSLNIEVGKDHFMLTSPEKIFYPKDNITKQDIAQYYARISSLMLPLIKHHPLTLHRFPDGITGEGFYQKDVATSVPSFVHRVNIPREDGTAVHYIVADNAATLSYLAQIGCVTPHAWLSTADKPHYPDRIIFDLDPAGTATFSHVKKAARILKKIIDTYKLTSFVMTTGSRGLHVVIPIVQKYKNEQTKNFAYHLAQQVVEKHPELCTLEMKIANRGNRIFVDTLRNSFGQTGVAPYALRAKPHAPIATPLAWSELSGLQSPQKYTIANIFKRLSRRKDPWHDFTHSKNHLRL